MYELGLFRYIAAGISLIMKSATSKDASNLREYWHTLVNCRFVIYTIQFHIFKSLCNLNFFKQNEFLFSA